MDTQTQTDSEWLAQAQEQIGSPPTATDEAWLAEAQDQQFMDKAQDLSKTLEPFHNRSTDELAGDYEFKPEHFYNEHKDVLAPEHVQKLVDVAESRRQKGITPGAVGEGLSNVPGAVTGMAKGVATAGYELSSPKVAADFNKEIESGKGIADAAGTVLKKKAGEAVAGVESMATGLAGLARTGIRTALNHEIERGVARKVGNFFGKTPKEMNDLTDTLYGTRRQADIAEPTKIAEPYDAKARFFNDAAQIEQAGKTAQGQGVISETTGLDAETLKSEGITLDPEVIAGVSAVSDPTLWLPMLAGLKAAQVAGGAYQVTNGAGKVVATAATRNAASRFIKWSAGLAEKGAVKAGEAIKTKSFRAPLLAAEVITGHTGVATIAGTLASKLVLRGVAKGAELGAKLVGSDAALDLLETTSKGAAAGTAFGAPFAAATDDPSEAVTVGGVGTALGAVGSVAHVAATKTAKAVVRARQIADATYYSEGRLEPVRDFVLNTPGMETLEAEHARALSELKTVDEGDANILNRLRAGMAVEPKPPVIGEAAPSAPPKMEGYLMSQEFAEKLDPRLKGQSGVHNITVQVDGKPKSILAWVMDSGVSSLTHEPGHFIEQFVLTPEERTQLLASVPDAMKTKFNEAYLSRQITPELQAKMDADPNFKEQYLQRELLAELFSAQLEGAKLDQVPPSLLKKTYGVVGRLLERTGLYEPGLNESNPRSTRGLGVENSFSADAVAEKVVDRWLNDPEVKSAMSEITDLSKPPKVSETPAPAAAAPVATSSVTPQHEQVLAGLKKAIPGAAYNKLALIAEKLKRGETLTASEQNLWAGVDQAAGGSGTPVAAAPVATTPPVIEPAKPVAATPPVIEPAKPVVPPVIEPAKPAAPPSLRNKPEALDKFTGPARTPALSRVQEALTVVADSPDFTPEQKTAVASLLNNLRTPHDVVYNSAKAEGGTGRVARRADIEAARGNPDLREVATKLASIPLDARLLKNGDVQVQFWSGDKVLANVEEATRALKNAGQEFEIPYDHKGGKLTEQGSADLAADLQKYTANQDNGYRGNGEKLNRVENFEGFVPDENPDYTPQKVSQKSADFINLLMGEDPPETARINAGTVPIQVRAKKLASANAHNGIVIEPAKTYKAPFADVTISDYNPLRARLAKTGVNLKGLTEAHEWVNAKEIQSATARPDIKLSPTATDVTAAGFLPSKDPRAVVSAAVQDAEGQVWTGSYHGTAIDNANSFGAKKIKGYSDPSWDVPYKVGFMTGEGEFLSRDEAFNRGVELKQISEDAPRDQDGIHTRAFKDAGAFDEPQFLPVSTPGERVKGNPEVSKVAKDYTREAGIPYVSHSGNRPVNETLAKQIADAYEAAKDLPADAKVKKSYAAFGQETVDQWNAITASGVEFEPWTKKGQPYRNSTEMTADIRDNKHLWFFPTEGGFGTGTADAAHPLLQPSGIKVGGRDLPVNDVFRAVHDYFGHAENGYEFGPRGELNAFLTHSRMYSDEARPAMAAETLGQNSWVNFGKHLRDEAGNVPKKGEPGYTPLTERPFAQQKATTLPQELVDAATEGGEEPQFLPSKNPRAVARAAVMDEDGNVYTGSFHGEAAIQYWETKFPGDENNALRAWNSDAKLTEGWTTNEGEFLDRDQAFDRAIELKQYKPTKSDDGQLESTRFNHQQDLKEKGYDPAVQFLPEIKEFENADTIKSALAKPGWTIITATKEAVGDASHPDNVAANAKLKKDLTDSGYNFEVVRGKYNGVDQGENFLVTGVTPEKALEMGREYGQESVLVPEGLLYADGTINRAVVKDTVIGGKAGLEDNFSQVGKGPQFSMGLDFSERVPFEGAAQPAGGDFLPKKFWLEKNGKTKTANGDHAKAAAEELKLTFTNDTRGQIESAKMATGSIRGQVFDDTLFLDGNAAKFSDLTRAQRQAIEDAAIDAGLPVNYNGKFIEDFGGQFLPKKSKTRTANTDETDYSKYNVSPKSAKNSAPTVWVLPDGERKSLDGTFHESDLSNNAKTYDKRFGTDFAKTNPEDARLAALNSGFVRVRYTPNDGAMRVEAGAKFWGKQKSVVLDHALDHENDVDKLYVSLLDDQGNAVSTVSKNVFQATDKEQAIRDVFSEVKTPSVVVARKGPGAIQIARAFPEPTGGDFLPEKTKTATQDLFGDKVATVTTDVRQMTVGELKKAFPEALVPRDRSQIDYGIEDAPLVKEFKTEDEKVSAYADRLVEEANRFSERPEFKDGLKWYSEFVPMLKEWFGENSQLFAELLAATSPRTNPTVNFGYAAKAFEGWMRGEYDAPIRKFKEGLDKMADGSLEKWFNKVVPKSKQPENVTPGHHLAAWVEKHDLVPTQWGRFNEFGDAKEVKFGMHGERILRVFARRWMDTNQGPKVKQFVQNLTGVDHGATVDVWAARTMRRLGYDTQPGARWRILPEMEKAVSDADFAFSQKVFAKAAEKFGVNPDDLQGAMWFAEKQHWADKGWAKLNLGDFRKELEDFIVKRKLKTAQGDLLADILPVNRVMRQRPAPGVEVRKIDKKTQDLFDIQPKSVQSK